ncbi:MAG: S-layer homology domain-containing protein, partial [bacterium]
THGSAQNVIVDDTKPSQWYRIRCDIDMDAHPNRLDVYVDDTLAASGIALADGAITDVVIAGEGMPGAVLIDELRGSEVRFYDVPGWSIYHDAIDKVAQRGIAGGCSLAPPLFCPDAALSRAQAAVFLLIAEHGSGYVPPDPIGIFQDVPTTSGYARWIERLYTEGITGGCATNPRRFCPDDPVTREQIAVFLLLARWGTTFVPPDPVGRFEDVPTTSPYARWIEELAREGITAGCTPTKYCPHDAVSRGQMSAFTVATWGL